MNDSLNAPEALPRRRASQTPPNLFDFSLPALKTWCRSEELAEFRATQLLQWIYRKGEIDFEKMSNISKPLRQTLSEKLTTDLPRFNHHQCSKDGTIKWTMALSGGGEIETVYIPEENRGTLCVSSQVGCALACKFCATGRQGFQRNLKTHEIIAQVWRAGEALGQWDAQRPHRLPITNIVFMGMGEPLLNTLALFPALEILLDTTGFELSKRRVTVSTSGVVPGIYQLGRKLDVALAVSLHAPNDALRDQIMPINRRYPLAELLEALRWYLSQSKANAGGLTIEYILLKGINDQAFHAKELAKLFAGIPVKINLIPWNRVEGIEYEPSAPQAIEAFGNALRAQGLFFTQRKERGADIAAACGQLVGNVKSYL